MRASPGKGVSLSPRAAASTSSATSTLAKRPITADDLFAIPIVGDPRSSPDGSRVAYVVTHLDKEADDYRSAVWLVPIEGGVPRQLTAGAARDSSPRWSPDGRTLAFVSTRAPMVPAAPDPSATGKDGKGANTTAEPPKPLPQIWLLPVDGGEPRQLTNRPFGATSPAWSPDGGTVAFLSPTAPEEDSQIHRTEAVADERVIDLIRYKHDGRGFVADRYTHLWTVPAAGGEPRRLTAGPHDDDQPAWSPDGRSIAFVSNRGPGHERNAVSAIYLVPATGGDTRPLVEWDARFHSPAWSPDGRLLAFAGHDGAAESGRIDRLWTVPTTGGEPDCRTADWDVDCSDVGMSDLYTSTDVRPAWVGDDPALLTLASMNGEVHAWRVPLDKGQPALLSGGRRRVAAALSAGDGLVLLSGDLTHPFELSRCAADGSAEHPLTAHSGPFLNQVALAVPGELRVRAPDGGEVQGWMLKPPGADAGDPLPTILQIHGGPHAMYGSSPFHELQLMAAKGYLVLFSNPRGSAGYGEAFATTTRAAWGETDAPDVLAVVDEVVARGLADPARLGVCGGSYGGYLTNWLVGHDGRFAAAVTMRCVSNFHSFYGTSDIGFDFGEVEFGGTPWGDAARLLALSPISSVEKIETPLLIVHNEGDLRCPIEQAEQLFVALKRLDKPTRFVRIPEEDHDLSRTGKPSRRLARLHHLLGWFDHHLQPASGGGEVKA
ncbi:MAG: Acylamino-acid-releasing enzyme [uncultured Thermomicrobiales bacterium]|uniref:Acylamino-acid-releasing enzyme n=1 Tax=uncultured Thermomicrobiales bacterium TaxID=1645740 RepID=A0A6J4U0B7_9BACT|nr:MAG: Acylamino-acid-releasing enzyme [uncultured Thermomicrobiales bacterium]